uniref:SH3 domain-containing protein n=1 Tax=Parastrongyloides trichosuri TaxID=131310 RepID=A0A0N4ZHG7_PARTI
MQSPCSVYCKNLPLLSEDEGNNKSNQKKDIKYVDLQYSNEEQNKYDINKSINAQFLNNKLSDEDTVYISSEALNCNIYKKNFEKMYSSPSTAISEILKKCNQERTQQLKIRNDDEMETSSDSDDDLYIHKVLAPLRKSKTTPGLCHSSRICENNMEEENSLLFPILKSQTTFNFLEIRKSRLLKEDIISDNSCDLKNKMTSVGSTDIDNCIERPIPISLSLEIDKICNVWPAPISSDCNRENVEVSQKYIYNLKEGEVCKRKEDKEKIENEKCNKEYDENNEIEEDKDICKSKCCLESNSILNNMNLFRYWSVPANIDYFGEIYSRQNTISITSSGWSAPELEGKNNSNTITSLLSSPSYNDSSLDVHTLTQTDFIDNKKMSENFFNNYTNKYEDEEDDDLQLTKFGDIEYYKRIQKNISFIKHNMPSSMSDGHLAKQYQETSKNILFENFKNSDCIDTQEDKKNSSIFDKNQSEKFKRCNFPLSKSMIGNWDKRLDIVSEVDEKSICYQNDDMHYFYKKDHFPFSFEKVYETSNEIFNERKFEKDMSENLDSHEKLTIENMHDKKYSIENGCEFNYYNGSNECLFLSGSEKNENCYFPNRQLLNSHSNTKDGLKNSMTLPFDFENSSKVKKQNIMSSHHNNPFTINSMSTSLRHDNTVKNFDYNSSSNISASGVIGKKGYNREKVIMPHSLSFNSNVENVHNSIPCTSLSTLKIAMSPVGTVRKRVLPKRPDFIDYISIIPGQNKLHPATTSCAMSNYRIEDDLMYQRDFLQYNSGQNVNQHDGGNFHDNTLLNNNKFSNSLSQQFSNSRVGQNIAGSNQGFQGNINSGTNRSHRKLPPLPIKAGVAALIEGITKPLPPSISSLMNSSNHIPQQVHSSLNQANTPGSLDYDVHIEPQMQHSPCYPYVKANTANGRNPGDHQLCYGIESTIIRSTCTIEDSYYEDGLNGNAQGSVKQVIHTNNDDSSGVSSCCTNIDNLNPTHRVQNIFIPRHEDEILLEIGDAIHVEREYEDHWCFGTNLRTGKHGIFPSAHICEIDLVEEICMGALNSNPSKPIPEDRDTFYLTMLASIEVAHHKGNDVLVQAINKVMSCYQNKEEILVPQTVLMEVSLRGIHVIDKKKKNFFRCPTFDFFYSLQNISFCGAHPKHLKYFGFITKHPLLPRFACHVFLSNQSTQPIVEAIGRAFKRSYDEYMAFAHPTEDIYIE